MNEIKLKNVSNPLELLKTLKELKAGTNIKTINGQSIVGSGNIDLLAETDGETITTTAENKLQAVALTDGESTITSSEILQALTIERL